MTEPNHPEHEPFSLLFINAVTTSTGRFYPISPCSISIKICICPANSQWSNVFFFSSARFMSCCCWCDRGLVRAWTKRFWASHEQQVCFPSESISYLRWLTLSALISHLGNIQRWYSSLFRGHAMHLLSTARNGEGTYLWGHGTRCRVLFSTPFAIFPVQDCCSSYFSPLFFHHGWPVSSRPLLILLWVKGNIIITSLFFFFFWQEWCDFWDGRNIVLLFVCVGICVIHDLCFTVLGSLDWSTSLRCFCNPHHLCDLC